MNKILIFTCLLVCGLTTVWRLSRTRPIPREPQEESAIEPVAANPELSLTRQAHEPRTRLRIGWPPKVAPVAAAEPPATEPSAPPEDPDELRQWARENPDRALEWMVDAPAGGRRDTAVEMVCAQMAETDPARAVALAERYSGGSSNLLENLVHQWAGRDESAAYSYALSKPPGEERDRLLSRVAFVISKEDAYEAALLVAEEMMPGEIQNEAAISVLHQWALNDPREALAWAESFPQGRLRNRALREVANLSSPTVHQ